VTFNETNVRRWMLNNATNHMDPLTGEVNMTALAEAAANAFDESDVEGPLDDPDHWIWELAASVPDSPRI
jgi:hypothetical protein